MYNTMADLNEIFNEVEKIKVSIVMQVNLGDYENSRTDAIHKFHRAVESFGNQIYKNCELIIVSDGCLKTQQHYNRSYKEDPKIKFVYYDRPQNSVKMYGKVEGHPEEYTYYRGLARRLGAAVATGDVIAYMDSDDIIAPEFTITLMLIYNQVAKLLNFCNFLPQFCLNFIINKLLVKHNLFKWQVYIKIYG